MAKYYRGNCLSENNKDNAISQTNYYKFKVNWVRRECWLRNLFEKGEVPTLTPNDKIYIPEEFTPSEKLEKFYTRKFNSVHKILIKNWLKERKFFAFKNSFFAKLSIASYEGNVSLLDKYYEKLSDPNLSVYFLLGFRGQKLTKLTEDQKIEILLHDSTFLVQIEYQPAKKVSNLRDILKISEAKKEFKFSGKFVPTKKVLVKKNTEELVPSRKVIVKTV